MNDLRTILVSILVILVAGAVTGVPESIHLCSGEPVETACAPVDCCGDEPEDTCCESDVTVSSIDEDMAVESLSAPSPLLRVIDLVPVATVLASVDRTPQGMHDHAEAFPPPPPDRSILSIYLI